MAHSLATGPFTRELGMPIDRPASYFRIRSCKSFSPETNRPEPDDGGLAAKRRRRRKSRNRRVSPRSRSADTEAEGDEPNEQPSGSLPRIDLGLPPVPINRMRILQESNRVSTETIPISDRPRSSSCAADRISLFHRRRTVPNRRTEGWPRRGAKGAKIGIGGCHRGHEARTQRRKGVRWRPCAR